MIYPVLVPPSEIGQTHKATGKHVWRAHFPHPGAVTLLVDCTEIVPEPVYLSLSAQVKSRKFCKSLHASSLADEDHQRLLPKDRCQLGHVEILPPALPFFALLGA